MNERLIRLTGTPKRAARFLRLSNSSGSTSSALGAERFFPFEGAGFSFVVRFARASSCSAVYDSTLVEIASKGRILPLHLIFLQGVPSRHFV